MREVADRLAIEDTFAPIGPVRVRRMFGGHGVYLDEACFALVLRGTIWLKADSSTKERFAAASCTPFSYKTRAREMVVEAFWSLPDAALDDADAMRAWCAMALDAARRTLALKTAARQRKAARTVSQPRRKALA